MAPELQRRVTFVASRQVPGKSPEIYYDGAVVIDGTPSERTARYAARFAAQHPNGGAPVSVEMTFDAAGQATLVEVFVVPGSAGVLPELDLPLDWTAFSVRMLHTSGLVGEFALQTQYFTEQTVRFAMAHAGSDYFYSDKYKFALWEPYSALVQFNLQTGRPARMGLSVRASTYEKAQQALATYLAMGGTPKRKA